MFHPLPISFGTATLGGLDSQTLQKYHSKEFSTRINCRGYVNALIYARAALPSGRSAAQPPRKLRSPVGGRGFFLIYCLARDIPRRSANNGSGSPRLWSPQHGLRGCFYLCRSRSFLRGDNGMDRAGLGPKALFAQKPE